MVQYRELEPQYTKAEKQKAESLEAYKEGYEQAVHKACMDAQDDYWESEAAKMDKIKFERTERNPDLPDFEKIYDDENDEWEFSEEDQEWIDEFMHGWNDAHTKHYKKMLEIMESLPE